MKNTAIHTGLHTAGHSGHTESHPQVATWTAWGSRVHVSVADPARLPLARSVVKQVMRDMDEVASRFRPDSELSRVNAAPGRWVAVDPLLIAAVERAIDAAEATGGLVHPLLGRPLVELGYDRDLATLVERPSAGVVESQPPPLDAWREIEVDPDRGLRIPAGTALDLGATGKAWCTDLAVAALADHGVAPAVVSIGGDLRTVGLPAWPVAVAEHPDGPTEEIVELSEGALATSSTRVRRWTSGGVRRHHLLDPRTGGPAIEVWRTVTVAADTCVAANTASTAAVVLGSDAPAWLTRRGHAARLVAADGTLTTLGDWPSMHRQEWR